MFALSGKVIVVIGGTTGLGLSAAKAFTTAGAKTFIVGRNQQSLDQALEQLNSADGIAADATHPKTAAQAIGLAIHKFGAFNGLYHVAGGSGRKFGDGPAHEVSDEGIDVTLNLNLKSLIYSNRAAIQQFIQQKTGGSILNMTSVLGFSPAPKYFATHIYAAAKAGIIGFTKSAAAYYAPQSIRVNALAPALVETPMAQRAASNEEILSYIRTKQPLDGGRIGRPEDLDSAAAWFMSDDSRFCTGQVLAIDGGWSLCEGQY